MGDEFTSITAHLTSRQDLVISAVKKSIPTVSSRKHRAIASAIPPVVGMDAISNEDRGTPGAQICHATQCDDLTGRHTIVWPQILLLQDPGHGCVDF